VLEVVGVGVGVGDGLEVVVGCEGLVVVCCCVGEVELLVVFGLSLVVGGESLKVLLATVAPTLPVLHEAAALDLRLD
jgi:hypothetical protein